MSDGDQAAGDDLSATPDRGSMRVGDLERNSALEALGEHLAAGRLTIDEYGDRSARVTVVRTAAELSGLFDDLPAPHPVLPGAGPAAAVAQHGAGDGVAVPAPSDRDSRSTMQKLVGAAAGASVVVALALFFITGSWLWFLLIPGISAVAGSIWGPDWKEPRSVLDRQRRDQIRDERRRERHELSDSGDHPQLRAGDTDDGPAS